MLVRAPAPQKFGSPAGEDSLIDDAVLNQFLKRNAFSLVHILSF